MNVIWWDQQQGYWDHYMLMDVFDRHPDKFKQYNLKEPPIFEDAIVIVPGKPFIPPLRHYLEKMKRGTVILTSEEDAYFNWKEAIPKHLDIWTQYYHPSTKSEIKTRLLLGPTLRMRDVKINKHLEKKYLFSFVGQVQNPFRQKALEVMTEQLSDGYIQTISGFGGYTADGMDFQEYIDIMCQSKFVVAPAGSMNCDSFRVYEAMLCGAIPITDKRAPRDPPNFNYWEAVCPYAKLVTVDDWNELPDIINTYWWYDGSWWDDYQKEFEQKLLREAERI